jgi:hypothetical protein
MGKSTINGLIIVVNNDDQQLSVVINGDLPSGKLT